MQSDFGISRVFWALGKSTGIWLSVWAIRYKADWDYRLSATAKTVRWGTVFVAYFIATNLPGERLGTVRVLVWLVGLVTLCWPNFAYHLTNRFVAWPKVEGDVVSTEDDGSDWLVYYAFQVGSERYGGSSLIKRVEGISPADVYPVARKVMIQYDPLNPTTQSGLVKSAE